MKKQIILLLVLSCIWFIVFLLTILYDIVGLLNIITGIMIFIFIWSFLIDRSNSKNYNIGDYIVTTRYNSWYKADTEYGIIRDIIHDKFSKRVNLLYEVDIYSNGKIYSYLFTKDEIQYPNNFQCLILKLFLCHKLK